MKNRITNQNFYMMKNFTLRFSALLMFLAMGTFTMAQFNVTMSVDMTNATFDPATQEVYVSGNVFDWAEPGSNPALVLTVDEANPMIYTLTTEMAEAGEILYKYAIIETGTPSWENGEWDGDPNRKIYPVGEGTVNDVYGDKPMAVTFSADMTDVEGFDPATTDVYMAGTVNTINNWQEPGSDPSLMMMAPAGEEMIYTLELMLNAGSYLYKNFIVETGTTSWDGGEWTGDPNREAVVDTLHTEFATVFGEQPAGIYNAGENLIASMFPNPCQSAINITFINNVNDITMVEVYNIVGSVVQTIEGLSSQSVTINTEDFTSGVYFVAVHNEQGIQTAKFVKE